MQPYSSIAPPVSGGHYALNPAFAPGLFQLRDGFSELVCLLRILTRHFLSRLL